MANRIHGGHINVEELVELAAAGHQAEVEQERKRARSGYLHRPMDCSKCLNIAAARMKLAQADESESHVVLYIP